MDVIEHAVSRDVADSVATGMAWKEVAALATPLALAACGGASPGGGADTPAPAPAPTSPVVIVTPPPTAVQASRFLAQATMGATSASIAEVTAQGYGPWLDAQFAMPRATSHWDWLIANGYNVAANMNVETGFDAVMWSQAIAAPDQLRQRIGMALLDILVVGISGVNLSWKQFATAAYVDVLMDNAFGNFRDLLTAVTTNAAMGSFLSFLNNRKANPATGAQPDENYARELMQLFTLGLYQLNMDGSVKTNGGTPLETYGQADVSGLARVFTGLALANSNNATPDRYRLPMVMTASTHETGASTFLGATVPAGVDGMIAIRIALDTIFAHPNLPPFFCRQLIQRLVTSNPSPGYVQRVASIFADNGKSVRGDMKAVIRAVLTDADARGDAALASTSAGKLRDPVLRLTGWARAFGATSPSNAWPIGDTSSPAFRLGQSPGRSPSVFGFFRPGYAPPASTISGANLVAPEFQITNEQSVVAYVNHMHGLIYNGAGDLKATYAEALPKAGDAQALVDHVNLVLAAGQLSATTASQIKAAVESISMTATGGPTSRVYAAVLLCLASPDYLTVK